MHRRIVVVAVSVAVLFSVLIIGPSLGTAAQEGTPESAVAGHPLIGAWLADVDTADPENPPSLLIFHDDGTYIEADPDGSSGVGAWEASGPNTAMLTALFHGLDESGAFAGTVKVRATIEVDVSGDAFSADYTLEFITPDGTSSGELGPGTATGERIVVEPMGTPVGSMEAMMEAMEEATPAP